MSKAYDTFGYDNEKICQQLETMTTSSLFPTTTLVSHLPPCKRPTTSKLSL